MKDPDVFRKVLGKTVEHVLIAKPKSASERIQVCLVFSDGTSCELWGSDLGWASALDGGGVHDALQYLASRPKLEVIAISKPRKMPDPRARPQP